LTGAESRYRCKTLVKKLTASDRFSAKAVPLHYFCNNEENFTPNHFIDNRFIAWHHLYPGIMDKKHGAGKGGTNI
jgi:hypothetical protein